MLLNCYNGKFYVGSSVNLKKREKEHFNSLRANHHANKHLQNSYNKYGNHDVFTFIVICFCDNAKLVDLEQWYIDTLEPEYNICPTAGNLLGYKHTKETKQKLSNSRSGKKHSDETKKRMSENHFCRGKFGKDNPGSKRVIQLTKSGEIINEFGGLREAERKTGIPNNNISSACRGKYKSAGGYLWRYVA